MWSSKDEAAIPDPDTSGMESQVAEAIGSARTAVDDASKDAALWGRLGMVFQAHELFDEAAESYAVAEGLAEDFRWPYLRAQCLREVRKLDVADEALDRALSRNPGYPPLYVLRGELSELLDDGRAEAAYREALEVDERSAPAHFALGRLALSAGEIESSREHLETAARLSPEAGAVQATLARLYRRLGDRERALEAAALARELHPEVTLDDPVMASVAEEAVSVVGLQSRAVEAAARGDAPRAELLLRRMVELRPEDPDLHYNLGNNLSRQGRSEEAGSQYREALALRSDHVPALINLGNVLSQRGDLDEAETLFSKALEHAPDHAGALANLAKISLTRGDAVPARAHLERAMASDPRHVEAHYLLAQIVRQEGRGEEAARLLGRAATLAPQRGDIATELAITLAGNGDFSGAWDQVRRARSLGWAPPAPFIEALSARMAEPERP